MFSRKFSFQEARVYHRKRQFKISQFIIIIEHASKSPLLCLVLIHCMCVCGSTVVQCSPLSDHSNDVRMNCTHPLSTNSYSSTCVFNCDEGFKLIGSYKSQCDHTGQWTPKTPTCKGTKSSIAIYINSFALYKIFFLLGFKCQVLQLFQQKPYMWN